MSGKQTRLDRAETSTAEAPQQTGQQPATRSATDTSSRAVPRIVIAWLTQFAVGTDLFVVSPLLPEMSRGLDVSVGAMGLTLTLFSVAYIVGAPALGRLGDRRGRRSVLCWSLLLFAVANLATALAPGYPALIVARVVAGVAAAGTGPTVYALSGAAAPPARRGTHLAIVGSGLLSALWAGAPLGSLAGRLWGWRVVFLVLAIGAVLLTVASLRLWWGAPGAAARAGGTQPTEDKGERLAGLSVVAVTALWALGVYLLYTFLGTALEQTGRSSWTVWMLVCYGIGAVSGSLLGGRLADRLGAVRVVLTALVLAAAVEASVAALWGSAAAWLLGTTLLLFALCAYATFPAQQRRLLDRYPQRAAALMGWNNSALFLGISIAGVLGPPLMNRWGFPGAVFCGAAAALVATGASVAAGIGTSTSTASVSGNSGT
ncbi:MFS transporter [Streptomyces sp. NPDC054864]